MKSNDVLLLPQPQVVKLKRTDTPCPGISAVNIADDFQDIIFHKASSLIDKNRKGRTLFIRKNVKLTRNDEYHIDFSNDKIILEAKDPRSAFCGICTLADISRKYTLDFDGSVSDWADLEMRILMIDLKRLDWNFNYLLEMVERAALKKINYIMIEYEDKFRYDFCDKIAIKSALTKRQVRTLNEKAAENFIEIIPLVQSLAHYEYLLKYNKYEHLRENSDMTSQACPMHPETLELFKKMASEVIELHPSKYFHIGGDEPFLLGTCPKCSAEAKRTGPGKLYTSYMNKVIDWIVKEKGRKPLIWADILLHHDDAAETCSKEVIAVDWSYQPKSGRSDIIRFNKAGISRLDYEAYKNKLTAAERGKYDKYLKTDHKKKNFASLPFGPYLKEKGFEVIGGSHIGFTANVLTHTEAAITNSLKGNLATYWASANSMRPPYSIYETRWAGICMLAASGWNAGYESEKKSSFIKRFSILEYGTEKALDAICGLDDVSDMIPPNDNNEKDKKYFSHILKACANKKEIIKASKGKDTEILFSFIEKILLEKELYNFKNKRLKSPLLAKNSFKKIDISASCNMRFSNTEKYPGWSKNENNDLRYFPKGNVCFDGIPYRLIKDKDNGNNSVIFAGKYFRKEGYPEKVENITIGEKAEAICFLHGAIEGIHKDGHYGKYIINYEDSCTETINLRYRKNIGEWWNIKDIEDANIACSCKTAFSKTVKVGLFNYVHYCKYPGKKISSVDFICESQSLIALCGLTIMRRQKNSKARISLSREIKTLKVKFRKLKLKMIKQLGTYLGTKSIPETVSIAFDYNIKYLDRLKKIIFQD